jgi:DNA repair protein RecN (Recombination protein N)
VLRRLEVQHLAILERVALEFGPGLNVLTGETGAGKSLLLDALQLALGARGDPGLIRHGERTLRVSALFEVAEGSALAERLEALGAAPQDGCVLLTREVAREGRGTCRINGLLATAAQLREVGALLLAVAGQGEHHRLVQPTAQLDYLDAYAGPEAAGLRRRVAEAHAAWREALRAARETGDAAERARRREALARAVAEIDALALQPDEEERLGSRRRVLAHAARLLAAAEAGLGALWEGEGAVRDRLGALARELAAAARLDPALEEPVGLVEQAAIALDEAARALRRYRDGLAFDPAEAAAVEERWAQIQRCKRKYGESVPAVLAFRAAAARELEELDAAEARAARLEEEVAARAAELGRLAGELSRVRAEAARRLESEVARELAELGMAGAALTVRLEQHPAPDGVPVGDRRLAVGERGVDAVQLLWAANPGEPPQPLAKAASGGELSRLLLALHALRAEGVEVPSLVFDEVDAGIGGRAAAAVAERLQRLGATHQVLCVTHLPTVAAAADRHFVIEKQTEGGRTHTSVRAVEGEARAAEIARMLDGGRGAAARAHAREMLRRLARSAG